MKFKKLDSIEPIKKLIVKIKIKSIIIFLINSKERCFILSLNVLGFFLFSTSLDVSSLIRLIISSSDKSSRFSISILIGSYSLSSLFIFTPGTKRA